MNFAFGDKKSAIIYYFTETYFQKLLFCVLNGGVVDFPFLVSTITY